MNSLWCGDEIAFLPINPEFEEKQIQQTFCVFSTKKAANLPQHLKENCTNSFYLLVLRPENIQGMNC